VFDVSEIDAMNFCGAGKLSLGLGRAFDATAEWYLLAPSSCCRGLRDQFFCCWELSSANGEVFGKHSNGINSHA
jgi:hypothetical protein